MIRNDKVNTQKTTMRAEKSRRVIIGINEAPRTHNPTQLCTVLVSLEKREAIHRIHGRLPAKARKQQSQCVRRHTQQGVAWSGFYRFPWPNARIAFNANTAPIIKKWFGNREGFRKKAEEWLLRLASFRTTKTANRLTLLSLPSVTWFLVKPFSLERLQNALFAHLAL